VNSQPADEGTGCQWAMDGDDNVMCVKKVGLPRRMRSNAARCGLRYPELAQWMDGLGLLQTSVESVISLGAFPPSELAPARCPLPARCNNAQRINRHELFAACTGQ
jgi:hypothetical protein